MKQLRSIVVTFLWLLFLLPQVAQSQVSLSQLTLLDSGDVEVQWGGGFYNRRTGEYQITATLTNRSSQSLPTPIYLAIENLDPPTVGVTNETGVSTEGVPYFVLDGPFGPNQSLSTRVFFDSRIRFTFDDNVYGGTNQAPVAVAGPDVNVLLGQPLFLDGTDSYDPDGGPSGLTFDWQLVGAPSGSTAQLSDPGRPDPLFQPDLAGEYRFELQVDDGAVPSNVDEVVVTASAVVAPPNAVAGPDQSVELGQVAVLDGSQSYDPNGFGLSYDWDFISLAPGSGLGNADILNPNTDAPSFIPDVVGTFELRLVVDNGGLTDEDSVLLFVQEVNVSPNADAGSDRFVRTGEQARLDGSASFDPNAGPAPLSYDWTLVSKPVASGLSSADFVDSATSSPGLTPDVEGSYIARLRVSDGQDSDSDNAAVIADDTPPLIVFLDPTAGEVLDTTTPSFDIGFNDLGSGIDLSSFQAFINGVDVTSFMAVTPTGAQYTIASPLPAGDNSARARISDMAGNSNETSINFTVSAFRAIADCAPTSGNAPLTVRYRSRAEFTGGSIVRYRWDFDGNGSFDTNDSVARDYTRTWSSPATILSTLQVTNNLGQTASDTCTIQVGGNAPTATANSSPSNGQIPLVVNFTCVGQDDGSIELYEWDFEGDGIFDFSSTSSGSTTHTYNSVGTFEAVCRVTDNDGMIGEARTLNTTIVPRPPGAPTVTANASPTSGNAPLRVNFSGSANDGGVINATIVLWEWDFDGDGVFDYSSATSASVSHTYTEGGVFGAVLRATDNDGDFSQDSVEIVSNVSVSLSIPNDTLVPGGATSSVDINTTLTGTVPVRLFLQNKAGELVRTLVDETRTAGSYSDAWDGRDDAGNLLPQDPYYAILEYRVGDDLRRVDLTNTTGGTRYNPSRGRLPSVFRPFEDDLLEINFTVPSNRGASEVQAFVGLFRTDTRLVTLLDREPLGVGSHTIYWNGLDGDGNLAVPPPGDRFLFGIWGFTLPDNAIFIQSAPVLSNVSVEPNYFDPATPDFLAPTNPQATVTYSLNETATVELTVTNIQTGRVLKRIRELVDIGVAVPPLQISWDGHAENGLFADAGDYRLELRAIDSTGSVSLVRYALVRVFY